MAVAGEINVKKIDLPLQISLASSLVLVALLRVVAGTMKLRHPHSQPRDFNPGGPVLVVILQVFHSVKIKGVQFTSGLHATRCRSPNPFCRSRREKQDASGEYNIMAGGLLDSYIRIHIESAGEGNDRTSRID